MLSTPEDSSEGISRAPSQEYFGGRLVVGTPNSLVSTLLVSAVAVSEEDAVATMSPWRFVTCRLGVSTPTWTAASMPLMPAMLRLVSPVLFSLHAGVPLLDA